MEALETFRPFSGTHLAVVIFLSLIWGGMIWCGVRWRGTRRLAWFERGFALFYLLQWLAFHGWWMWPGRFNWSGSLPIHICDIVALLMPFALVWRSRLLLGILYFWGIGLSLQGIITPDLGMGPLTVIFWIFWLHHTAIVGAAVYMLVVHRFRPKRKDLYWSVVAGLVYLAVVFPIDAVFGFNYGYLGPKNPSQPTLIDILGPWPWRVGFMSALAGIVMGVLLLPWEVVRWWRRR